MKIFIIQATLVAAQLDYIYHALNEYVTLYTWDTNVLPMTFPLPVFDAANFAYDTGKTNLNSLVAGASDYKGMLDKLDVSIQENIDASNPQEISKILNHFQALVKDPTVPFAIFDATVNFLNSQSKKYKLPATIADKTRKDDGKGFVPIAWTGNFSSDPLLKDSFPIDILVDGSLFKLMAMSDSEIQKLSGKPQKRFAKRVALGGEHVHFETTVETSAGIENVKSAYEVAGVTDVETAKKKNKFVIIGNAHKDALTGTLTVFMQPHIRRALLRAVPRHPAAVLSAGLAVGAATVISNVGNTAISIASTGVSDETIKAASDGCKFGIKRAACDPGNAKDIFSTSLAVFENFGIKNLGLASQKVKTIKAIHQILQGKLKFTVNDIITDSPAFADRLSKFLSTFDARQAQKIIGPILDITFDPLNVNLIAALKFSQNTIGKMNANVRKLLFSLPQYKVLGKILEAASSKKVAIDFAKPIDGVNFDNLLTGMKLSTPGDFAFLTSILDSLPDSSQAVKEDVSIIDKIDGKIKADPNSASPSFKAINDLLQAKRQNSKNAVKSRYD
ncbi:hypothetical protein HDV06_002197 [Boothiomyces sp. JEL0866]|nr:hypothetical protein HDV06_002197 [Boothiomyces sp. JEL0866]